MRKYRYTGDDVAGDIASKYGFEGDLARIFTEKSDALVHKWHHYIPLYDRYFGALRGTPLRFLEIGVSKGGSLRVWREYLGERATIFGIDIDPACAAHDGRHAQVRIGSQADPDFLQAVVDEMGGVDVVLDDGSHVMSHIRTSLEVLFPRLSEGGLYMIEDLHTAYYPKFEGGVDAPANFFNMIRELTDDMHRWYHPARVRHRFARDMVSGLHIHDSLVVIEKNQVHPPAHSRI